jgi:hypothetical protein
VPIAALDRCFRSSPFMNPTPLIGETWSGHPAGRWIYLASFNACHREKPIRFRIDPGDLGAARPDGPVVAYDWRSGAFERLDPEQGIEISLDPLDWDFRILCPVLPPGITLFGDVTKYATVGDRRVSSIRPVPGGIEFEVLGAPAERIEVHGWAGSEIERAECWADAMRRWRPLPPARCSRDSASGRFVVAVEPGAAGRATVRLQVG